MAARPEQLLQYLRRLVSRPASAPESDAVLLARFACDRDEAAFAALVARHGRMVLGVCRRVLGDAHAAEDAAQATWLVLARKAPALRRPQALAASGYTAPHASWPATPGGPSNGASGLNPGTPGRRRRPLRRPTPSTS